MKFYHRYDSVDEPACFTFWSFMHFIAGISLYVVCLFILQMIHAPNYISLTILLASIIHLLYECKDFYQSYLAEKRLEGANSNSWINSLCDQLCATFGILLAWVVFGDHVSVKDVFYVSMSYVTAYLIVKTVNYEREVVKE